MSERITDEQSYPFYWLDEVIEITLNPERSDLKHIKNEILENIQAKLPDEINKIIQCVKNQAFFLYSNEQVRVVAGHYDLSIRVLLRQALSNQQHYPKTGSLHKTGQSILAALDYLSANFHNRYSTYLPEGSPTHIAENQKTENILNNILCALSADQIGIVLRSAFDVKIIVGNSFRKVCKAIAPYLSTPWKKNLSWDSIRSNSGRPELRDKEVVIQLLEKMIERIKGYR